MKAILIDPVTKSVTEVEYDGWSVSGLHDLLGTEHYSSRVVRPNEVILFDSELKPDAANGFTLPLPAGSIRCMGRAVIIGSVGGRTVDTQLTSHHVEHGLFWSGVDHAVS